MKNRLILNTQRYEVFVKPFHSTFMDAKILLMLNQVHLWAHRTKSRKALARLSPEQVQDIGLSQTQIKTEINKPFWK